MGDSLIGLIVGYVVLLLVGGYIVKIRIDLKYSRRMVTILRHEIDRMYEERRKEWNVKYGDEVE